jgi:hypothetical protein
MIIDWLADDYGMVVPILPTGVSFGDRKMILRRTKKVLVSISSVEFWLVVLAGWEQF